MQGFNMGRYVPPEHEGVVSGNKLTRTHALGKRGAKASQGILTVRFEMPYPIWCTNCPKPTIIGQGVRFNAEKKKVGAYYSTPIYSFRFKHVDCGGWIEIRTDPKNTAYVVVEGARKRDTGEDVVRDGDVTILTAEEREKLRSDAFAAFEGRADDKKRADESRRRIEEIYALQEKQWEDPYTRSQQLRRTFRRERHELEKAASRTAALQDKMGLGMELLPESAEDAQRASFVEFGVPDAEQGLSRAMSKPLFATDAQDAAKRLRDGKKLTEVESRPGSGSGSKTSLGSRRRQEKEMLEKRRETFVKEVQGNTRAATDPFLLENRAVTRAPIVLQGLKRKREEGVEKVERGEETDKLDEAPRNAHNAIPNSLADNEESTAKILVDYDSD